MPVGTTLAIASTAASFGFSQRNQRSARRRQRRAQRRLRRAAELQIRQTQMQNARARQRAAIQASMQQGAIEARSAAMGGTSTGFAAAQGALSSQLASNISFQRDMESMEAQQIRLQARAGQLQARGAYYDARSQLPAQLGFGVGNMIANFGNIRSMGNEGWGNFVGMFGGGDASFTSGIDWMTGRATAVPTNDFMVA